MYSTYLLLLLISLHCSYVILHVGIHKIKFFLVILILNPDGDNFTVPKLWNARDTTQLDEPRLMMFLKQKFKFGTFATACRSFSSLMFINFISHRFVLEL